MSPQDLIFTAGGIVFVAGMVPTLINPRAAVPLATSLPTSLVLLAFAGAQWSLSLVGGGITNALTGLAWLFVAARRRTQKGSS